MVWYSPLFQNFPQFVVTHTVKGFGIVNKADVFLELSRFFDDPAHAGNLIFGSSAFSKSSLNIWKFTVHVLLKSGLENFEHYHFSLNSKENTICHVQQVTFPHNPGEKQVVLRAHAPSENGLSYSLAGQEC